MCKVTNAKFVAQKDENNYKHSLQFADLPGLRFAVWELDYEVPSPIPGRTDIGNDLF